MNPPPVRFYEKPAGLGITIWWPNPRTRSSDQIEYNPLFLGMSALFDALQTAEMTPFSS